MKSKISQHFTEPVRSLLCSQEPAICPCPQPDSVHYLPFYFFDNNFNLSLPSTLCLPCGLFPYDFSIKTLYEFLFSCIRDMCLIYLILLDLITQIISVQEHRSLSVSSICYILLLCQSIYI